jgi:H+-translocating NAD(P) transhydrogenase subunit alpha
LNSWVSTKILTQRLPLFPNPFNPTVVIIAILKEPRIEEKRVAINPTVAANLMAMGYEVWVEKEAGLLAHYSDEKYASSGAKIKSKEEISKADIYIQINPPEDSQIDWIPSGKIWISNLYPKSSPEKIERLNRQFLTALSLDSIPRISRAQSMDILSSQANLAGYRAVIEGAYQMDKIFPLLMTAAGTVTPAKVLIFGAGVAGLQAIATAKRLGAVVEATDLRPETKEQVLSLGAKFIEVQGSEVGSEGGYAKEATEEYRMAQREAVNRSLAQADLVITTALVPGKKAPLLIDDQQLELMKSGAVIIDMAAEQGGNCSQTKKSEIIHYQGIKIVGTVNLPSKVASNASDLFSRNIWELIKLIGPKGTVTMDLEDEIVKGCLVCHQGNILQNN